MRGIFTIAVGLFKKMDLVDHQAGQPKVMEKVSMDCADLGVSLSQMPRHLGT